MWVSIGKGQDKALKGGRVKRIILIQAKIGQKNIIKAKFIDTQSFHQVTVFFQMY